MEKAYDLKELEKMAKEAGLPEVEQLAEKLYGVVKKWVNKSAAITKTPLDDLSGPAFTYIDKFVEPQLDKIDGDPES